MEIRDCFEGEKVLVAVAHHDDEAFIFGHLLAAMYRMTKTLHIVAMSDLRRSLFERVCGMVGATPITIPLRQHGKDIVYLIKDIVAVQRELWLASKYLHPDVVVTHGFRIDGQHYHPYHLIVNLAVKELFYRKAALVVRDDFNPDIKTCRCKTSMLLTRVYGSSKWNNMVEDEVGFKVLNK